MTDAIVIDQNDGFAQQIAAGGQTQFDYDFPLFDENHIKVLRTDAVTGDITVLVITTDYTVQDVGEQAGGTITLNPTTYPSGATVNDIYTMRLNVPEERTSDFQQAGDFFADVLNEELDLEIQMIQQLRRDLSRAARLPDDNTISEVFLPAPEDGLWPAWVGSSGQMQNVGSADTGATAATAFWLATLLTSTALSARTALGLGTISTQNANAVAIVGGMINSTAISNCTVDNSVIGATTPVAGSFTSLNGGQLAGFRNVLINGDFKIWQRATTYALTTSLSYGSADRWWALMSSTAAGIANRDNSVPTPSSSLQAFQYSLKVGRNSGSSNVNSIYMGQTVATANAISLAGKKATLSFYAKAGANYSSAAGALLIAMPTGTGTDEGSASGFGGGYTGYVNTGMTPSSVTLTTSWQRFSLTTTAALPTTIKELLCLFQYTPVGTAGADDNFYITGVQIESGPVATPFEFRPFSTELGLCERYYEKSFPYATAPAQNAGAAGADLWSQSVGAAASSSLGRVGFQETKRVAPTVTLYNPSAANAQARNLSVSADCSATAASNISDRGFHVGATSAGGSAAGNGNALNWQADAEL